MFLPLIRLLSFITLSLTFYTSSLAAPLANSQLVFMIKTGSDSAGNPIMQIADSQDVRLTQLYNRIINDKGVQNVIKSHQEEQLKSFQAVTPTGMHNQRQADPVFIEVGSGVGTYNDWKQTFTITSNNQQYRYDQSRVVIDLNDPMFNSQDRTLVEQTFVHEIGHGIMRQVYGKENLPNTPWLGRPHYGDLVTDEALALIEGWAEFVGAHFTGRNTIAEDPKEAIMQNAYAYTDKGTPKSPEDLFKTEGWVATVLLWIAKHPGINDGYGKLLNVMRDGKFADFNEVLRAMIAKYPETNKTITEILAKASLNQISSPLGAPVQIATNAQTPPPINQPVGASGATDLDLNNLFDDYQSSLNTLAQLKRDLINIDQFYAVGGQYQEVQRRISFQESLVANLENNLLGQLKFKTGLANQEKIIQKLLDNLEKIRLEHNQLLQQYNQAGFWDQSKKAKIQAELALFRELYNRSKNLADATDQQTMMLVFNQRQERILYRLSQVEQMKAAAPASSETCSGTDCSDAYNKLLDAIKANQKVENSTKELLKNYNENLFIRE